MSLIRRWYDISLIRRWYDISLTPRMWKILPLSSWEQGELTWRDESPDFDLVERRTDQMEVNFKGTVRVSDPSCKESNARFTTVSLKPLCAAMSSVRYVRTLRTRHTAH